MASPAADDGANNIRVAVRCRPFNARELSEAGGDEPALECECGTVRTLVGKSKAFGYDHALGTETLQDEVFEAIGAPLLENALNAYNGCIFAYGQTGSGKSHSVVGDVRKDAEKGLLPRACVRLFEMIAARRKEQVGGAITPRFQATVLASYLEIYNEKVFDLLTSERTGGELQMRYHPQLGAIVVGLTECPMESFQEALELFDFGAKKRAVGATQMNAASSRSHAVFTIQVRMTETQSGGSRESQTKTHFVDLAGSEKQKKTQAAGDRLKEGIGINQSLTTLGRVISELTKPGGSRSMPAFRDSKLTLLLKDALMGNSRTELLACISPAKFNFEETLSTLEFASRCKLVKTSATKNEQSKVNVIQQLKDEKDEIEAQLAKERANSEAMCKKLQEELDNAAERQRLAERALTEKREIEEKLKMLEGRPGGSEDAKHEKGFEQAEREELLREKADLLREKEQMNQLLRTNSIGGLVRRSLVKVPPPVGTRAVVGFSRQEMIGTVRYAGTVEFSEGIFVGIELDEEKGKNDGSVQDVRYFTCPPCHGLFCRPEKIVAVHVDGPGKYNVLRDTVLEDCKSPSEGNRVADLAKGLVVAVAEVARFEGDHLVRARLEDPPGWFTLVGTATGERWANRDEASMKMEVSEAVQELHQRLANIKLQEERQREQRDKDHEVRKRLESEQHEQLRREQELTAQMEALKEVHESFALDQAQLHQKREEQHRQREAELSKLGMHFMGVELNDMPNAPKLVNLHPDPALEGCLIYYLPMGETSIGADAQRCRVTLMGQNIGPEVCAVVNTGNTHLMARPLGGGLVRVNGCMVSQAGSELSDGDRLAIGRTYIFQVQVPRAPRDSGALSNAESEFDRALGEISASAEVDPQWENGIEKAMMLVKSDFGTEAAIRLLNQAKRGTEACTMANGTIHHMPRGWTRNVTKYDLAIMFNPHGLPEVCVVARRDAAPSEDGDPSAPERTDSLRSGLPSAGIWEVEHFWKERLPALYAALSMSGLGGSQLDCDTEALPGPNRWESHVWDEISIEDYRSMASELESVKQQLSALQAQDPNATNPLSLATPAAAAAAKDAVGGAAAQSATKQSFFGSLMRGRSATNVPSTSNRPRAKSEGRHLSSCDAEGTS
eukprot:TRINITY_DN34719_c0_g1_i2.p1 TRINITY_DN34719_c0_g1~~TRINITY_DN34719_c0_g1_i2.p1  ORF type:complete len:1129 (-),score=240.23 TRINITY_DN34719_c0_g1_i2:44-3430(-)